MLTVGVLAPEIELASDNGTPIRLSKLKGKPVVLYFYPKDDTSGCTAEARDFSCLIGEFMRIGTEIFGVSPDSQSSHQKFRDKHGLTVRLLADEEKAAANAYGVWVEKAMYGKKYMGVERATFLIDRNGRIARIWRQVKVPGHAEDVLAAARTLAK
jgi:peroxiredoxin Q/BCP